MKTAKKLNQKRMRRVARTRALISGTAARPRLAVHRSNRFMYAQLIDDTKGRTILSASSASVAKAAGKTSKTANAFSVGELLAKKAIEKGITSALFDRRSYKFHGRVKGVADGARKGGLTI